jgi:hypothetical protein
MKLTKEEFWKMNEVHFLVDKIVNLSKILLEYEGEKELLIEILFEKIKILEKELDDFTSCLIT